MNYWAGVAIFTYGTVFGRIAEHYITSANPLEHPVTTTLMIGTVTALWLFEARRRA